MCMIVSSAHDPLWGLISSLVKMFTSICLCTVSVLTGNTWPRNSPSQIRPTYQNINPNPVSQRQLLSITTHMRLRPHDHPLFFRVFKKEWGRGEGWSCPLLRLPLLFIKLRGDTETSPTSCVFPNHTKLRQIKNDTFSDSFFTRNISFVKFGVGPRYFL